MLFAADGYRWNGHAHDRSGEVRALQRALPTLRATVGAVLLRYQRPARGHRARGTERRRLRPAGRGPDRVLRRQPRPSGPDPAVADRGPGAPLPAAAYPWVRDAVGPGSSSPRPTVTDVVGSFAGSVPTTPIWAGELSAPMLGVALQAWDADGRPVVGEVGELVATMPMPAMPLFFWNGPDGVRYREAYFDVFPWRLAPVHGLGRRPGRERGEPVSAAVHARGELGGIGVGITTYGRHYWRAQRVDGRSSTGAVASARSPASRVDRRRPHGLDDHPTGSTTLRAVPVERVRRPETWSLSRNESCAVMMSSLQRRYVCGDP